MLRGDSILRGNGNMDFVTAVKTGFAKFATFQGRAARSEFWFFTLFTWLVSVVLSLVDAVTGTGVLSLIFALAVLIPGIAVAVRRLHDTDRSGWWYLLLFVPIVGIIVLIIWFCSRGTSDANRFGSDPLAAEVAAAV